MKPGHSQIFVILVLLISGVAISPAQAPKDIAGTWEGESLCTVPDSPCHNELVVYRVSPQKDDPGKYMIAADKIVNGRPEFMGDLLCSYDTVKAKLRCVKPGLWEFSIADDVMTGTLKLDDGTLYRKISVRRRKAAPEGGVVR